MAQKVQVVLIDDLDGGTADETVTFGLDGVGYEIDLSDQNADRLRQLLAPYVDNARRVGSARRAAPRSAGRRATGDSEAAKIRAWAKQNGHAVSERGRVSAELRAAYAAAQ
jgi:hypothetical protein